MDRDQMLDAWYSNYYNLINSTARQKSITSKVMHWSIERTLPSDLEWLANCSILEVGAGRGEHTSYVKHPWQKYVCSDIRRPSEETIQTLKKKGIDFQACNVEALRFRDESFNRVILTCLLHHVVYPEKALAEIRRVTKSGGIISIMLPTDPGITYRFLRQISTRWTAKRKNIKEELEIIHALEHRNHYLSLIQLIKGIYSNDIVKVYHEPFKIPIHHLNAFSVYQIRKR